MDDAETGSAIIPTLRYRDAAAAIEWLCAAFGFEKRLVVRGDDGSVVHAQLTFGKGMVMLSSPREMVFDQFQKLPEEVGAATQSPYVTVDDVEAHHARAVAAGAEVVVPLATEEHGTGYSCRDPEGHLWNFGNYDPWAAP